MSLFYRDLLAEGVSRGLTSLQGLTAHGRGEAFDYLLGETTRPFARLAVKAAAAYLLLARRPVLSVNGNTAVLVPEEIIALSRLLSAPLEVNLFHAGKMRERKIARYLKKYGAETVLLPDTAGISAIDSNRRLISKTGQAKADVIFVPLEDGDRTGALLALGKKVITVDLNPLSRTAQNATVTVVDNLVRALPLLIKEVTLLKNSPGGNLKSVIADYDNKKMLSRSLIFIRRRLGQLSQMK